MANFPYYFRIWLVNFEAFVYIDLETTWLSNANPLCIIKCQWWEFISTKCDVVQDQKCKKRLSFTRCLNLLHSITEISLTKIALPMDRPSCSMLSSALQLIELLRWPSATITKWGETRNLSFQLLMILVFIKKVSQSAVLTNPIWCVDDCLFQKCKILAE